MAIRCPSDVNQFVIRCPSDAPVGHAEGEQEHKDDRAVRVLRDGQTGGALSSGDNEMIMDKVQWG